MTPSLFLMNLQYINITSEKGRKSMFVQKVKKCSDAIIIMLEAVCINSLNILLSL